ncbi:hypothetical protein SVIO_018880 [Streptomyces violaceusniger]|uniref:Uncharacterized protein n=1 Tax=Streptomyces violaceusniger TaxID=68280 RepID=A0A4D4KQR5_STRVO|nr:hypothetical protein SVIO_018880 [Streptomyces violaceusniger]
MDHGAQAGQLGAQLGHGRGAVVGLAAVAVAVHGEEHHRFDLLEAVQDAAGAEVRGAGGPYGADGGGGQEGHGGLGDVRDIAADPVARADAEAAQFGGDRADLAAQLGPADRARIMDLVDVEQRGVVGAGGSSAARRACSA